VEDDRVQVCLGKHEVFFAALNVYSEILDENPQAPANLNCVSESQCGDSRLVTSCSK
jgi:hypothetical protein